MGLGQHPSETIMMKYHTIIFLHTFFLNKTLFNERIFDLLDLVRITKILVF